MASSPKLTSQKASDQDLYTQVKDHYDLAEDETDKRRTGRGRIGSISFDEADELFRSWLDEKKWPYDALLVDPRTFTFIFEKTSRLFANKLRGRLIPREGSDVLASYINNELLNFQWDLATYGGSMMNKWALMDINARKYGASFALCKWRFEKNGEKVVYDGPEMRVLRNRDCLPDIAATSIEDCNWFQVRDYVTLQDLHQINDSSRGKPIYKNLDLLEVSMKKDEAANGTGGDTRSTNWISRNRTISGLTEDPIGRDRVFKTVEIVTEYRRDRWVTFSPRHGVILRDIKNPYENNELPIVMLRYYPIDDDLYGLSEIEPVKGLQKAINALLSQYVDEINQNMQKPVAIGPGVKDHTLRWGPGARWRMNNPQTDIRIIETSSNAAAYFTTTYSALVAAMMTALGESSLGVSNIGRFNPEKTATEVQSLNAQRNARDSFNQQFLAEAIKRQMMLWHQMNQKMLFSDPTRKNYIIRIVGNEAIKYFQQLGLNQEGLSDEAARTALTQPNIDPSAFSKPLAPVNINGEDVSKFQFDEKSRVGQLIVEPGDLQGNFDFIADVTSMSLGTDRDEKQGRSVAITALLSNPNVLGMLNASGTRPKFKELFIQWLEDSGFKDAEKFFEDLPNQSPMQGGGNGLPPELMDQLQAGGPPQNQAPSIPNIGQDINSLMNPNVSQSIQ